MWAIGTELKKTISLKVTEKQYEYYMKHGGSKFLRQFLEEKNMDAEQQMIDKIYEKVLDKMRLEGTVVDSARLEPVDESNEKSQDDIKAGIKSMFGMFE